MIVTKIKVDGVCAVAEYRKLIPAGIIGAQVRFDYADDVWQGLRKTVVFRGLVTKDVITDDEVVTIPAEVVAKPNVALCVGVYGVDAADNIAIPTLWADLGTVRDATDPSGDPSTDPSLPVWAKLQAMIGDLDALDTVAKNNIVAAINEAMTKGGGGSGSGGIFCLYEIGKRIMSGAYSKIVLMGDSITDGYGGTGYNGSQTGALSTNTDGYCWANAFSRLIVGRFGVTVDNNGMYGTAADEQVAQAKNYLTGSELVIWLSGTNNRCTESRYNNYVSNMGQYISDLQARCADLVVMSCVPATKSNETAGYVTSAEICEVLVKETTGKAYFFDMRTAFIRYCDIFGLTIDSVMCDGLHPNDTGYWIMFKLLCDSIGIPLSTFVSYKQNSDWWGDTNAALIGISATYSGGDVAVGTAVTDLTGVVVIATYANGSTETVTGYTLSGTIAEGRNTVTVTYDGMTTTFTVTGISGSGDALQLLLDASVGVKDGDTNVKPFDSWSDGIIPVMQMAQYDSAANTTLFSGKTIKKILFYGSNGFSAGTLTFGTVDLTTIGEQCVMENTIMTEISADNAIVFENGFTIPDNHTLACGAVSDTARLNFYFENVTAEIYMCTKDNWISSSVNNPSIALPAKFYA